MRTQKNHPRLFGTGSGRMVLLCLAVLAWTGIATAQLPGNGASVEFDMTGFIQHAVLDGAGTGALQGGHIKLNGQLITVPSNTIVILPGKSLTWAELFTLAPAPYTGVATGMATDDKPAPLGTYEAHVIGNVMTGTANGQGEYVAGVIWISQQGLNHGAGYINFIDYAAGEIFVGGNTADRTTGARLRLNDPTGEYGRVMAGTDVRFAVDPANPTIRSATGFPMCLPRSAPGAPGDGACPETQRSLCLVGPPPPPPQVTQFCGRVLMNDPTAGPPATLNPFLQAPFEIGDYVDFAGTLATDALANPGPTAGPWPGTANTYISASSIIDNVAIYTWPNTNPAYVTINTSLLGTGGNTVLAKQEASTRTRFEGFSTDFGNGLAENSRIIHLYGMDLACDGSVSGNRDWGMTGSDPGLPKGAIQGRWRFRPPCTGTIATISDKVCVPPGAGVFLPATREVRAVLEANPNVAGQVAAWTAGAPLCPQLPGVACNTVAAGNLLTGQVHFPIADYIFPEQVLGSPIPPANFDTIPFLTDGGYSSTASNTVAGQLNPFPFVPTPPTACALNAPPVVTASADVASVTSGGIVNLSATATGAPTSWAWTEADTPAPGTPGTFNAPLPNAQSGTWTAPVVSAPETATFSVTATNGFGTSAPSSVSVTVNPATPVITSATASPSPANAGATVTLSATATGTAPINFAWTQVGTPVVTLTSISLDNSQETFTAPVVATSTTLTFNVTATNAGGTSPATVVNAIINPAGTPVVAPMAAQTVFSGRLVTIPLSASTTDPSAVLSFTVAQGSGPIVVLTVTPPVQTCTPTGCTATASASFTDTLPSGQTTADSLQFSVTATDATVGLTSTPAIAAVTVNPLIPVVNHVATISVPSGGAVTMPVSATSPNPAANLTLSVVQTTNFTLGSPITIGAPTSTCTANGCTFNWNVTFTAETTPFGQTNIDAVVFAIKATDTTVALTSATEFATVNVNPPPVPPADTMLVTVSEYRITKQRLIINITDSVINPGLKLTLQPYVCQGGPSQICPGGIYNPGAAGIFTNNGGGLYIVTIVGAPPPACKPLPLGNQKYATPCTIQPAPLDVKSNIGGDSLPFELLKIRTQ